MGQALKKRKRQSEGERPDRQRDKLEFRVPKAPSSMANDNCRAEVSRDCVETRHYQAIRRVISRLFLFGSFAHRSVGDRGRLVACLVSQIR